MSLRSVRLIAFLMLFPAQARAGLSLDEKESLHANQIRYDQVLEDSLSDSLDLQQALRYGAQTNAKLKAAFYRWKAAAEGIVQAGSLDDPDFTFKTFLEEVETRVGPQRQAYSTGQKIPFPVTLFARADAATAVARQRYAEFQKARLEVYYEIKDVFLEYWYLRKQILVAEENSSLLKRLEGVAQSKFKSGLASNQDLLKAQVELGKIENDLLTLGDLRMPIVARFNAVLNRDIVSPIGWPEQIEHSPAALDATGVLTRFRENNPDLEGAQRRIEETKKKVLLARLDIVPDVTIGVDHIKVSRRPMGGDDNGNDATALMFKVNVPLWLPKQASQIEEAKANETAAQSQREQLEKDLAARIHMVLFKIQDAQRQIQLYRDALVPKAQQSLKASEAGYTAGNVDFLNLIDSQRVLLNFQLSYYRAIRDYEQRLAELEMMVGQPLRGEKS